MTCQKSFCVAGAILLPRFSRDALDFSWQAQHFGDLRCHFSVACAALSTCRVACFFANRIVRAARSGDKVQIPWQAWYGVVFCDMWWKSTEASHETSILSWSQKISVGKRRFWCCAKCEKIEEVSHEMLVLMLQHVSSRVAGFFGAVAVSIGGRCKNLFWLKVSKQVVMSFCVAGVAFVAGTALWRPPMSFACTTLLTCSGACFVRIALSGLRGGDTLHSELYTPPSTLYTPHFTLYPSLPFKLRTLHSTLHTVHSTLYTPHSRLHTPHFTLYTLHFTLHTLFTLHVSHFLLHAQHFTLHTLDSISLLPQLWFRILRVGVRVRGFHFFWLWNVSTVHKWLTGRKADGI